MTGGPNGIAYRSDYFENEGWDVPVTTQEMAELIVKMKGKGYTPFIWPGKYGYWSYIVLPWWAQYAGDQGIEDFWNCLDTNGELSEDAYRQYARYEAFAALETMIGDTSNSHEKSMTEDHMATQNLFYADSNKICMMPNGEWLENEMKKSGYQPGDKDIGLMRPPVLSSILKDGNTDRFETIKTEEKLREVIRVIDAEGECPDDVDPEEFAALTKIRSYVYTTGFQMSAIIPAYSNAKEGAKKFLAFVASDKGNQIYYNESGSVLPYDQSGLVRSQNETQYQKDRAKIERNATFISILDSSNKMFYKERLEEEESPKVREILEKDLIHLDRVQIQTASAREFLFILRFRNYNPETNEVQTGISRMTKLLKDAGVSYRQASKEDIKRLYAVYFVQNITQVYFDDYDGERFVKGDAYR